MTDQYIITEEQLQEVYEHCDWGMTNWTKFKSKLRPYQGIFRDTTVGTSGANR
jgi:acetone carboxylase gamma subunit